MASECGLFSFSGSINTGSYYDEKARREVQNFKQSRGEETFKTSPSRRTLSDYSYVNDPYIDRFRVPRQRRIEQAKKNIDPRGFVPSSPGKISSSTGDYYGAFQKRAYTHLNEGRYKEKLPRSKVELDTINNRQMVTSPSKVGLAGATPGLLMGEKTLEYIPFPYDAAKEAKRQFDEMQKVKEGGRGPFRTAQHEKGCFDGTGKCGASRIYSDEKNQFVPLIMKLSKPSYLGDVGDRRPWTPGNVGRRSVSGLFSTYQYQPGAAKEEPQQTRTKSESTTENGVNIPFKPSSTVKSYYIKGRVFHKPIYLASLKRISKNTSSNRPQTAA